MTTEIDVLAQIERGQELISDLDRQQGDPKRRRWIMSIPARPDYDPDWVLSEILYDARAEITALRTRLAEAMGLLAEIANLSDDYTEWSDTDERTDAFLAREGYTQCVRLDGEWGCGRWLAPGTTCPNCTPEGTDG